MIARTNKGLREYYDRKALRLNELAATYEHPNWYKRFFYQRRFRVVFDSLDPRSNERILDLGAGPGYYSHRIAERGATPVATDIARNYLVQIPSSVTHRVSASAESLPFQRGAFDKVLATEILEHTLNPEAVLSEIARVLKPGGRAVITSPSSTSYMDRLYELKAAVHRYEFTEHLQEFQRATFVALLSRFFRVKQMRFANCLVPYPLDFLVMRIPGRIGLPMVTRIEEFLAEGRGGPRFGWTMVGVVEGT